VQTISAGQSHWQQAVLPTVLAVGFLLAPPTTAAEKLTDPLARLDATVAPPADRKALASMLVEAVRNRRQELNDRNTAEWKTVKDRAGWQKFLAPKLAALRSSLGKFPGPPRPLRVRITGTLRGEGFSIDKLVFESRPGLWVTANLYRPERPGSSMPGILICHAHHTPKEHGELQDMGMTWARAGCLVLVPDQPGHGERRQHPFVDASSYPKPFRVSRQDYYFRFDSGVQLHLAGESLMGWMAWDLMRGVDLLLAQRGIDSKRILLLGAVAGGGDPAAVVAALDDRIAAVAPFNFGEPSPRPQYPYPADREPRWNYAGSGSWESTRNLYRSAADGFLPWVLVAATAPRRLVYAHEFGWYREGDPVWKRLQAVYGFYDARDRLAFTFGKGDVKKRPPEATHCTHIGAIHRRLMHDAFRRWFAIDVTPEKEYSNRLPADNLRCLTAEARRDLRPRQLIDLLPELVSERMNRARKQRQGKTPAEQRRLLRAEWGRLLGNIAPTGKPAVRQVGTEPLGTATVERLLLTVEPGIVVPLLLLIPQRPDTRKPPLVVAFCQSGKAALLRNRGTDIAALLGNGVAVCLPDLRGTGETTLGKGRGRTSASTAVSSSVLMLGETLVGGRLRDLRTVLAWLRTRKDLDSERMALWGDSLAPVNPPGTSYRLPRDDDAALPTRPEPLGGLLALLGGLYEEEVTAVYVRGGLSSFRSVLNSHLVLLPHDALVPGALTTGDLSDLAASLAPRPLRLDGLVDGLNRRADEKQVEEIYRPAVAAYGAARARAAISLRVSPSSPASWLVAQIQR
jgi:dienelactone hydrolase